MANGTVHEPQFMMRVACAAAGGGLVGSIIGALFMWWLLNCGCPAVG